MNMYSQIFIIYLIILGGVTVHSALDLKFGFEHLPLSDENLARLRYILSDLKLIIIDEVSLVPADFVYRISLRLCEVFQNKLPFGGKSTCGVGDLLQVIN